MEIVLKRIAKKNSYTIGRLYILKDEAELVQTKKYLAVQLKALVARDIWDMSQYFQVWNETNEIVQRAVKLLTTGK